MATKPNPLKPKAPQSAGSKAAAEIAGLLRARNSLLWIVSREETRVERYIFEAAASASYVPRFWDCATGISDYSGESINARATDPNEAIQAIRESSNREVWVMRDLHLWLRDPTVLRALRSLARNLTLAERSEARSVIVLSPSGEIPPELAGQVQVIDFPLPDRIEVADILDSAIGALPEAIRANAAPDGQRDAAVDAAIGLTAEETQACYAKSLVSTRKIDPATVATEKKRVIAREKVLEWIAPIPGGLDAVGGLDSLKNWLAGRQASFSAEARAYGLPAPKGVLLVGVPGCGKSLSAKAVPTAWGMPCLRLDMGALKSKWVGESEANIRKALRVAETVAPCVLWLDEMEKALAGATQGAADGGTSSDALGAILSWLQDRQGSVFVVATSNDVSQLPPELLRKGRFDDIFFVDLPTKAERIAILQTALRAHGREKLLLDFAAIADKTEGFTGAELAALVPDALYVAFAEAAREIKTDDLIRAASQTVPLSKTASEKVEAIRKWSVGRARPATLPVETEAREVRKARAIDINFS